MTQFNACSMPEFLVYRGRSYKLRCAAPPARPANQKLEQVAQALASLEQGGYQIKLPPKMQKSWTINHNDLLKSVDAMDGSPMLLMWNPITSELLMGSDLDVNAPLHSILHSRNKKDLQTYPDANYADWVRGLYDGGLNKLIVYKWEPLNRYFVRLSEEDRERARQLQKLGVKAFGKLLSSSVEETG
jgi:hypothetical protein